MTNYHIDLDNKGVGSILVYEDDGTTHEVRSDSPDFTRVFSAVQQGHNWSEIEEVTGVRTIINLSDRISLAGDELLFDGHVVDNSLTTAIKRYHVEGRDPIGLVNFMTKLFDASDSHRIRNFAFQWLTSQRLEVTGDGSLLGYRGLDIYMRAKHKGSGAFVDGIWDDGKHGVPNMPGTTITLPRHEVSDDPTIGCGPGLHVGNESYARSWGERWVIVEVQPKDIVSVPLAETQKMRVCAYKVIEEIIDDVVPDYEAPAMADFHMCDSIPEERADSWRNRLRKVVGQMRRYNH